MMRLEEELRYEIKWRTGELSSIRTIPILTNCNDNQKAILEKYSVVAIYSVWEGFVNTSFNLYIREINKLNLTYDNLCLNILTHDITIKFGLNAEQQKHFDHQKKFITSIFEYSSKPITITPKLPTDSNVDFKVINRILKHYNLEELPKKDFKNDLEKLLFYRNKIAHGECSITINQEIIGGFNKIVIEAMHEITVRIVDGYQNKKFLAPHKSICL